MAKTIINKNGTSKADVIEITKKVTVKALAGNDKVTIKSGSGATVYGGAGVDKIYANAGSNHKIYGEAGADTITIGKSAGTGLKVYGGNAKFTLSDKDSFVINGGKKNYFYGGKGVDTFTVNAGTNNYLYGKGGNDVFVIGKNSTGSAIVKDFTVTDQVKVVGSLSNIYTSGKNIVVKGGKGTLTLENANSGSKTFTVRDSSNSYTVNAADVKYTLSSSLKYGETFTAPSFVTTLDARNVTENLVNVTGNAKANTIYVAKTDGNYNGNGTYQGMAGNDRIIISGGNKHTVYGDDKNLEFTGHDTITVDAGEGHKIYGGRGNDTIVLNGISSEVDGGDGNDTITVWRGENTINGGVGDNTFEIHGGTNSIASGSGADIVKIYDGYVAYAGISTGGGADEITITGGSRANVGTSYPYRDHAINGGYGEDTITVTEAAESYSLNGGFDKDELVIKAGSHHKIYNDGGNDHIYVKADEGHYTDYIEIYGKDKSNNDSGANETVEIYSGSNHTIELNSGDDMISVEGGGNNHTIDGGSGSDTITVIGGSGHKVVGGNDKDVIIVKNADSVAIHGDEDYDNNNITGNDEITVTGGNNHTIYGRNGNDTINVTDGTGHTINGGDGADKINVADVTAGKQTKIYGGNGDDVITVTNSTNTYIEGGNSDLKNTINVTGGSGHVIKLSGPKNEINVSAGNVEIYMGYGTTKDIINVTWSDNIGVLKITCDNNSSDNYKDKLTIFGADSSDFDFDLNGNTLSLVGDNGGIEIYNWNNYTHNSFADGITFRDVTLTFDQVTNRALNS